MMAAGVAEQRKLNFSKMADADAELTKMKPLSSLSLLL